MIHILAPMRNAKFVTLMNRFLPQWRIRRNQLNQLSVHHEDWAF